jgi:hypothetical protein
MAWVTGRSRVDALAPERYTLCIRTTHAMRLAHRPWMGLIASTESSQVRTRFPYWERGHWAIGGSFFAG